MIPFKSNAFDEFWKIYPRKRRKEIAKLAWSQIGAEEIPAIMNGLDLHIKSEEWSEDDGKFVPNPAKYLAERRWEDEMTPAARVGRYPTANELFEKMRSEDAERASAYSQPKPKD